jgi:hypothetical protein
MITKIVSNFVSVQPSVLKGLCHEMDIFVEGPENDISTYCMCADRV